MAFGGLGTAIFSMLSCVAFYTVSINDIQGYLSHHLMQQYTTQFFLGEVHHAWIT